MSRPYYSYIDRYRRLRSFSIEATKWDYYDITYRLDETTKHLGRDVVRDALARAYAIWARVTPLKFTETKVLTPIPKGPADIRVRFTSSDYSDGLALLLIQSSQF